MDEGQLATLIERLWDGTPDPVYALLDGARDPGVYAEVVRSDLPRACLFSGALGRELARAAPYLVHLAPKHPPSRRLVELAWGNGWGIFCASPRTLEDLRRHFRRLLRVQDPTGKTLYFRYYDPRVFRVYLPTCNARELATFFGPVQRFMAEGPDPAELLVYRRAAGRLDVQPIAWSETASAPPA